MPADPDQLDWQAFSARYFPQSRRHDFGAVEAYEAYRNGLPMEERIRPRGRPQSGAAVEAWEGEGGAVQADGQEQARERDASPVAVG